MSGDKKTNYSSTYIPVHRMATPGSGIPAPVSVTQSTPIYSSYTGEFIQYGPILCGSVINDAPESHFNYDKPYRVINYNPINDTFMAHGYKSS